MARAGLVGVRIAWGSTPRLYSDIRQWGSAGLRLSMMFAGVALGTCSDSSAADPSPTTPNERLTEANLARICDNRIELYLSGMLSEAYQLTPDQKERFRARLTQLKQSQIEYTLGTAPQREAIAARLKTAMRSRTGTRPSAEMEELHTQLHAMNSRNPLFHRENAQAEIERLLPADQVRSGRERLRLLQQEEVENAFRDPDLGHGDPSVARGLRTMLASEKGWELYVTSFCSVFELDAWQRAVARSLLREAMAQRDEYLRATATGAGSLQDSHLDARTGTLQGIEVIWDRMRAGLDTIPTGAQISNARQKRRPSRALRSATRPTDFLTPPFPSTRPCGTQPSASVRDSNK